MESAALASHWDAFVPILDATNVRELREAVYTFVKQCLPKLEKVQVFLKNPVTEQIEADGVILPSHGVIWDALHQSTLRICAVPDSPDPVLEILHLHSSHSCKSSCQEGWDDMGTRSVILLPISSRRNGSCVGIVVACTHSEGLLKGEEKCLGILAKQVSVAYLAVQQSADATVCDKSRLESLISLCGELHDQDAATLELKVIRYLRQQTCSESGFLLLVVPDTQELISQVVGDTILPEEKRFPGLWSCFAHALETKQPMFLEQIPKDRRWEVEDIVGVQVCSFLCVPVARRGSNKLIALACLVNKENKNRFTDSDIEVVEQCFKYTATVITSTLAFQNERKLKNQTQALLHVAKQLFTRLGESARESTETKCLSPLLFAVSRYVSEFRVKYMGQYDGYSVDNKRRISHKEVDFGEDSAPFRSPQVTFVFSDEELAQQEANRRLKARRKRPYSLSIFRLYDPTSVEAEGSYDSLCDKKTLDGTGSLMHLLDKNPAGEEQIDCPNVDFDHVEPTSPGEPTSYQCPSKKSVQIKKSEKDDNDPASSFSILYQLRKLANTPSCEKQSTRIDFSRSKSSKSICHQIKTISNHFSYPKVPFSVVRALPSSYFVLPDGRPCPEVDYLRKAAPCDASYSDGDFLYDLTKLLREIMQEARNLTDAERCSVFLLDKDSDELVATVFDGITTTSKEVQAEIRLPKTQGIAGHVATTGTLLNIKDAYSHPLFYRGIDDSTGFRTRNILCFPIKDEEGVVLGVAQLCNKKIGTYFTTFDEDIASAFAVYCCISISHSLMYKKVIGIQFRHSLANELMMFHMKCLIYKKLQETQHRHRLANELMRFHMQQIPHEEVQELAGQGKPDVHVFDPDFDKFSYPPRGLTECKTPAACQAMFEDLGFINRWRLKSDTLARFLLMVKKGYRNPPYHNWMHAFSVAHFAYLCIKNLKLANYLQDIELLALFVSCLCHDIDHRGTTNSFQVKSQSVLAALYSSEGSVMERHHLAQSMCILNTEGSNIFENLNSKEYQQVLDLMKDIILATDVAHHLRIFHSLESMAQEGYKKEDPTCRNLLLCLLMTGADLSDQTKNWDNTKQIALLIYQEFFSQGDLEKALGENPLEMMDRERAVVPDLQISFLDNIAIPVYRVLADIFPSFKPVDEVVVSNRTHWEFKAQFLRKHKSSAQHLSVQEIIALGESEFLEEEEKRKQKTGQTSGR